MKIFKIISKINLITLFLCFSLPAILGHFQQKIGLSECLFFMMLGSGVAFSGGYLPLLLLDKNFYIKHRVDEATGGLLALITSFGTIVVLFTIIFYTVPHFIAHMQTLIKK